MIQKLKRDYNKGKRFTTYSGFVHWFNKLKSIHVINHRNSDAIYERFENK